MSYEVIARRWRPKAFSSLVGQDHIRQTLLNALKSGRLHHALLFTGPRGTGKTSSARILAKSLRCPNAIDHVPCNQCSECEEISQGRSLNVIEIDGASNNGVDAIRELRETVGYMPSSGKYKLYIIDEVHMLSTSAFNALLKTLEEPPGHIYFVLATTEVHKIPNTILSRCQRFDFRRIPTRLIAEHLQHICEAENTRFTPEAIWIVARQADGSMRDGQSLLEQVVNFSNGQITTETATSVLGVTDRGMLMDIWLALLQRDTPKIMEQLRILHQQSHDAKVLIQDLLEEIRHSLLLKLSADPSLVDLPDSEIEQLKATASNLTIEDLHLLFDMALKGAQDLMRASDPQLVLEMILLRMACAPRVESLVDGLSGSGGSGISRKPAVAASRPAPTANPIASHAAPAPVERLSNDGPAETRWKGLVDKIKEVNVLIGAQLENCYVIEIKDKTVQLGVPAKLKFLFDKINQPDFKKKVTNYLNTYWGSGFQVQIALGSNNNEPALTPKALAEKEEKERDAAVRKSVEDHPLTQAVQNTFQTEIKSIKEFKQ